MKNTKNHSSRDTSRNTATRRAASRAEQRAALDGPDSSATEEATREQTLELVLAGVHKAFGKESVRRMNDHACERLESVGSGLLSLDRALGVGGYPLGRVVEIFGPESSGKTTLTLHAIAEAQRSGGLAAFVDAEHAFDPTYARALGVQLESLLLCQPDSGEQALDIAEALIASGSLSLIVVDSVAALVPKAELEGSVADNLLGLQARLMSRGLRKLAAAAARHGTTLMFVNQLRHKIGVVFGSPETTPGGNALKYYSSVRLDVRRVGKVTVGERLVGNRTRVRIVKNKCAQPFREAEFDIRWGQGVDAFADILEMALQVGVVSQSGSHFSHGGSPLGQGKQRARDRLETDPALLARVREGIQLAWAEPVPQPCPAAASPTDSPERSTQGVVAA